jgi:hypothetical protein
MKKCLPVCLCLMAGAASAWSQGMTTTVASYQPITARQRLDWVTKSTMGPTSLMFSAFTAGLNTLRDSPPELGTHWQGFAQRYGYRLADRAVATGIEAGVGSLWGEDPRYTRVPEKPFGARVGNVLRLTVKAHDSSGHERLAYARFIAVPSEAFLSNEWKPDSQSSTHDAMNRIAIGFANHALANAWLEFWPDVKNRVFSHSKGAYLNSSDSLGWIDR